MKKEENSQKMSLDEMIQTRDYVNDVAELIQAFGEGEDSKDTEKFVKLFPLEKFDVFHPKSGHCLSGSEWAILMYLLTHHLRYIQSGMKYHYGNWIKMDAISKKRLCETLKVSQRSYERLTEKLVDGKIFLRVQKDFYLVNPYCFAKGKNVRLAREKSALPESSKSLICLTEEQKEMINGCKRLAASIQEEIERERAEQKAILAEKTDMIREDAKKISPFLFVDELLEKAK